MRIFMMLSVLFDYPDEYLKDHLNEIDALLEDEDGITVPEREAIRAVVRWMKQTRLLELQQHYVQTFDLTQDLSLHLTHHSFGESRERGPALVALAEFYKAHGFEAVEHELPDYLPLVLEFVTTLDATGVMVFLRDQGPILTLLAERLERAGSPYAALARVLAQRARVGEATAV